MTAHTITSNAEVLTEREASIPTPLRVIAPLAALTLMFATIFLIAPTTDGARASLALLATAAFAAVGALAACTEQASARILAYITPVATGITLITPYLLTGVSPIAYANPLYIAATIALVTFLTATPPAVLFFLTPHARKGTAAPRGAVTVITVRALVATIAAGIGYISITYPLILAVA